MAAPSPSVRLKELLGGELEEQLQSYKLPCDVRLPPRTTIARGCGLATLLQALAAREGMEVVFDDSRQRHRDLAELQKLTPNK